MGRISSNHGAYSEQCCPPRDHIGRFRLLTLKVLASGPFLDLHQSEASTSRRIAPAGVLHERGKHDTDEYSSMDKDEYSSMDTDECSSMLEFVWFDVNQWHRHNRWSDTTNGQTQRLVV